MYMLVSVVYLLISIMQEMTIYGIRTISAYQALGQAEAEVI